MSEVHDKETQEISPKAGKSETPKSKTERLFDLVNVIPEKYRGIVALILVLALAYGLVTGTVHLGSTDTQALIHQVGKIEQSIDSNLGTIREDIGCIRDALNKQGVEAGKEREAIRERFTRFEAKVTSELDRLKEQVADLKQAVNEAK